MKFNEKLAITIKSTHNSTNHWIEIRYNNKFYSSDYDVATLLGFRKSEYIEFFTSNYNSCYYHEQSGVLFADRTDCIQAIEWLYDNFYQLQLMNTLTCK